jgi:nitrile hydratase accessory protein
VSPLQPAAGEERDAHDAGRTAGGVALLEGQPRDADGPVFREPWEAQAFALALALHERGTFTWPEFAAALATAIEHAQAAGDADRGDTYYRHWLAALEALVAAKAAASSDELEQYRHAWLHAAARTPHGQAIELRSEDFTS